MTFEIKRPSRRNFDEEVDDYDRLKDIKNNGNPNSNFTEKAGRIKIEFDYEEDPYEPEK